MVCVLVRRKEQCVEMTFLSVQSQRTVRQTFSAGTKKKTKQKKGTSGYPRFLSGLIEEQCLELVPMPQYNKEIDKK